jgi:two-component system chemotaxis sensor kinase CheA
VTPIRTSPTAEPVQVQFDLADEDRGLFLAEADELIQRVEEALVELERAPHDQALLHEIFRAAHTIKGSSATIGHVRMAALTHAMETRLDEVRKGVAPVTPALVEALLHGLDVLKLLRDEVETGQQADVDVDAAVSALESGPDASGSTSELEASAGSVQVPSPADLLRSPTHRLTIPLQPGPWAAVRALQVLLALGERSAVLWSQPSQAEIEREGAEPGESMVVLVHTAESEGALHAALKQVPELGSVVVEALADSTTCDPAPAPAPDSRDTSPAPLASEAEPPKPRGAAATSAASSSKTVRIDVARLDALLNLVGELVVDRTRVAQLCGQLSEVHGESGVVSDLQEVTRHIGRITDELQEHVMKSRMLPVDTVFSRLPRVVRDVAAKLGKQVELVVEGRDTELDRSIIEEIGDPLMHLVRNAVDHGIETPADREVAGKPSTGVLRLSARHAESHILITLEDDGRGIDVQAVKRRAVERAVITEEQAARMDDDEAIQLIFHPGLSTAREVTAISGRGVGMDVVRANVEKLKGTIDVRSSLGQGTAVTVRLPLTLAILRAMLVRVGGAICALPLHAVTEILRVGSDKVHRLQHREAIQLRGGVLPLVPLRRVFGGVEEPSAGPASTGCTQRLLVVVSAGRWGQVGLEVDGLIGEQEVVIKPLGSSLRAVQHISGAAILGDGTVALIADVPSLVDQALRGAAAPASGARRQEGAYANSAV